MSRNLLQLTQTTTNRLDDDDQVLGPYLDNNVYLMLLQSTGFSRGECGICDVLV